MGTLLALQVEVVGRGPLAVFVTFLVASVFYAATLHLAALFFLGDVPSQRAAYVGPVLAVVSIALQRYDPAVVIPVTLLGDVVAIRLAYRLGAVNAVVLALFHFAFAAIAGFALYNLVAYL